MGFFLVIVVWAAGSLGSLLLSLRLFHVSKRQSQTTKQSSCLRLLACVFLGIALYFGVPLLQFIVFILSYAIAGVVYPDVR